MSTAKKLAQLAYIKASEALDRLAHIEQLLNIEEERGTHGKENGNDNIESYAGSEEKGTGTSRPGCEDTIKLYNNVANERPTAEQVAESRRKSSAELLELYKNEEEQRIREDLIQLGVKRAEVEQMTIDEATLTKAMILKYIK